ncbi:MAG: hypothetical protein H6661_09080 [Ardenticatenaceae bacterium]|nr:hypothetical protein [Ardenticatenaceae bacterium]
MLQRPDAARQILHRVGLGFANRVRRGSIGIVAASGTGLQAASTEIHNLGGGVSQAIGTGGCDLQEAVEAASRRCRRWMAGGMRKRPSSHISQTTRRPGRGQPAARGSRPATANRSSSISSATRRPDGGWSNLLLYSAS